MSKPSSTEAPFVCDPRRPPLWPRTLTLAAAAAAPPTPPHDVPSLSLVVRALRRLRALQRKTGAGARFRAGMNFDRFVENRVENAFQGAESKSKGKKEIRRSALGVEGSCVGSVRFVLPSIIVIHESEELGTPAWRKAGRTARFDFPTKKKLCQIFFDTTKKIETWWVSDPLSSPTTRERGKPEDQRGRGRAARGPR